MPIFRSYSLYFSLIGITITGFFINRLSTPGPEPVNYPPPVNPYNRTIAASGIVEAKDKNIEIGIPQSAIVKEVFVKVGDPVVAGQTLFQLDNRELNALLVVQNAQVSVSRANLIRLKDQLKRLESIKDPRAVSQEEINTKRYDVNVAIAQLEAAESQVTQTILLLERFNICSPQNGIILQSNIRKGEYAIAGGPPAMILGDLQQLQVRADIDEQNASSIVFPVFSATAFPKNNSSISIPLKFERIEPYVIPKRSLTGLSDERVDTRVLQIIFSFDKIENFPIYVGQQLDIFIEKRDWKNIANAEDLSANAI